MVKRRWKAYERVLFTEPRTGEVKELMLVGINFDLEQLELFPLSPEYEEKNYFIDIKFCSIPRSGLIVSGGAILKQHAILSEVEDKINKSDQKKLLVDMMKQDE